MIKKAISKQEIRSDLEQFKSSINKLMYLEDELSVIGMQLAGDTLRSPAIRSTEEVKYQRGTVIYRNNIVELMCQEEQLIRQRDYYLFRVRRVASFLQRLTDEEVKLLEYRYWDEYPMAAIAGFPSVSMSLGNLYKKFDQIYEK